MKPAIRNAMTAFRERVGATMHDMAKFADCSYAIIYGVECLGWITHPRIAARIAHAYKLDANGYNDLIHQKHRADRLPTRMENPNGKDWINFLRRNGIAESAFPAGK